VLLYVYSQENSIVPCGDALIFFFKNANVKKFEHFCLEASERIISRQMLLMYMQRNVCILLGEGEGGRRWKPKGFQKRGFL
jgi:hypothetical protein